jgi:hypothetical protein
MRADVVGDQGVRKDTPGSFFQQGLAGLDFIHRLGELHIQFG